MDSKNNHYANKAHSAGNRTPATGSSRVNVGKAERIISVAGGALLAFLAAKNFNKSKSGSIAMLTTGGSLLFRGATGYCPVNESSGPQQCFFLPGKSGGSIAGAHHQQATH
jgi:hypothetical protein